MPRSRPRSMPLSRSKDLHGSAPDKCTVALVLIDWINDLEFESGDKLLPAALAAARPTAALRRRAKQAGVPVIYCNDNFGKWRSDFRTLLGHVLHDDVRGRPIAELLKPDEDDYFVLKPKHSGFHSTSLDVLLAHLGAATRLRRIGERVRQSPRARAHGHGMQSRYRTFVRHRLRAIEKSGLASTSCTAGICPTSRSSRGRPSRSASA